jgi:hypothetical protein
MKTLMPYVVNCPGAVMYKRQLMFHITFAAEMLMHKKLVCACITKAIRMQMLYLGFSTKSGLE